MTALVFAAMCGVGAVGAFTIAAQAPTPALAKETAAAGPLTMAVRRITESQYRHIIRDVFGDGFKLEARFEPEQRDQGLQSIGNAQLSVTTSGFEQYFALAGSVATQIVDPKKRDALIPCKPTDPKAVDDSCTKAVVERYGRLLFRRPLTADEVSNRLNIAKAGTAGSKDYYEGLRLALASLLIDPEFLFRVEEAEPDPGRRSQYRMDAYSKASRLSFLLWDAGPDEELLQAAANGSLHKDAVLKAQVTRMLASPKVKDGASAFFTDMLQFEHFDSLTKDAAAYPKFSQKLADSAKEQTLKTVIDLLVDQDRDYRDLFTTNDTFIDRTLAAVYKVPYKSKQPWVRYTFPAEAERSGIVTQVTFLSLFSHPAASSPTKRGVKLHEIFLCQPFPDPPADVDFSKVQAIETGTVRTRLLAHMENEGCASCHKISDPMGLALEHFDGLGQRRTLENGQLIDVSADIDGKKFSGAPGVGQVLHDNPDVPACLVRNVYAYGVGRAPIAADQAFLDKQTKDFAKGQYKYKALLANVASSPGFFSVVRPEDPAPLQTKPAPKTVAIAQSQGGLK